MPELPSGITISKIKNASSATRSGATPEQTTVRFFAWPVEIGGGGGQLPLPFSACGRIKIPIF